MNLAEELLFRLSRRRLRKTPAADATVQRSKTPAAYAQWRDQELQQHLAGFPCDTLAGKQVLDFGCGEGALAFYVSARYGVAGVLGLDISAESIASARKRLESAPDPRVTFRLAEDPGRVDGDDDSIDVKRPVIGALRRAGAGDKADRQEKERSHIRTTGAERAAP